MNVDHILDTMNRHGVDYLLIGGMNFLLRHEPVLTFDVDLWIDDSAENRARCDAALRDLDASWGATEEAWGPIGRLGPDWLAQRSVHCLLTSAGPVDIFRAVTGLPDWVVCAGRAVAAQTTAGVPYRGLADGDMLACQIALDPGARKLDRIRTLRMVLGEEGASP